MCGKFIKTFCTQIKSIKKAFQEQVQIFETNQNNTKDFVNKK